MLGLLGRWNNTATDQISFISNGNPTQSEEIQVELAFQIGLNWVRLHKQKWEKPLALPLLLPMFGF